jgi:YidC/Oxa1 family membrane protein insertase
MYDAIRAFFSPILSLPLSLIYEWTGSYVLAILLLTIVIKIALLPVTIKQQKNSAKQTRLNAKVNRIRQKYANNQQKAQQEIQALYQREGFGAANMGCMPMAIQMLVMIGLYGVMYTPISSVLRFSSEKMEAMKKIMATVIETGDKNSRSANMYEIAILKNYKGYEGKLSEVLNAEDFADLADFAEKFKF